MPQTPKTKSKPKHTSSSTPSSSRRSVVITPTPNSATKTPQHQRQSRLERFGFQLPKLKPSPRHDQPKKQVQADIRVFTKRKEREGEREVVEWDGVGVKRDEVVGGVIGESDEDEEGGEGDGSWEEGGQEEMESGRTPRKGGDARVRESDGEKRGRNKRRVIRLSDSEEDEDECEPVKDTKEVEDIENEEEDVGKCVPQKQKNECLINNDKEIGSESSIVRAEGPSSSTNPEASATATSAAVVEDHVVVFDTIIDTVQADEPAESESVETDSDASPRKKRKLVRKRAVEDLNRAEQRQKNQNRLQELLMRRGGGS